MKNVEKSYINLIPFIICLIYFFYGFWDIPLFPPDEPKYTYSAMKMLESGDFLTPTFNCKVRLEKPIFTYWMIALSYKIFGISDWAGRVPTVFFMSLLLISLFFIVKKEFDEKVALVSALFFATNFQIFIYSKAIVPEPFLLVFNTLATFALYFGVKNESKKMIIIGYIFSGLAFLTKGPLGIIIPFGINIPYFFLKKGFKKGVLPIFNVYGVLLFLAINLPWYGMMIKIHGMRFINEFFIIHNIKRFSGSASMHIYPCYYYIPVIILSLFFWIGYLPSFFRYLFKPKLNETEKFLFWWIVFVFLFFSISKNKLHHYIIIIHPALAVLMGISYYKQENKNLFSNIVLVCLLIIEISLFFLRHKIKPDLNINILKLLLFFPISTFFIIIVNNLFNRKFTFIANILIFFILNCLILSYSKEIREKALSNYEIIKNYRNQRILTYKKDAEDINFYADVCTSKLESLTEINEMLKEKIPFILIVHEKYLKELDDYNYKTLAITTTIKKINWSILEIKSLKNP